MSTCPAFQAAGPYVTGLTSFIDCRVEALGREGYLTLAASGSPVMLAIGGLLTIFIALFGYRLLLGDALEIRDGVLAAVRVGIVLALATQWPAYQALIYNVVINGPGELAALVTDSSGLGAGNIPARIEASYGKLEGLAHPRAQNIPPVAAGTAPAPAAPLLRAALNTTELGRLSASSVVLLLSSLAGLLTVRIIAGVMLALGPLFVACLLFDGTRGLFEGWVRVLVGVALGSVAATITLAFELAILEPQLVGLVAAIEAGEVPATAVVEIFVTTLLFSVILVAAIVAAGRAAAGFRMFNTFRVFTGSAKPPPSQTDASAKPVQPLAVTYQDPRSRAVQIADGVRALQYRETSVAAAIAPSRRVEINDREPVGDPPSVPLGQSHRRRLASRRFASSTIRDRRA